MSDELTLEVGQANEIKLALRRARGSNGSLWTPEKVKLLTEHEKLLGQTLDVLEGRAEVGPVAPRKFEVAPEYLPVWRKLRVGGLDKSQLRNNLRLAFRDVSERGGKLLDDPNFRTSPGAKDVLFGKVTPRFLGFRECPKTRELLNVEFFADWSERHLRDGWVMELCECEDGPSVGYQYAAQQRNGETLLVAWAPVVTESLAFVWVVKRHEGYEGLCLSAVEIGLESEWRLDSELLVRLRKVQNSAV